jgi:hypothetical protein
MNSLVDRSHFGRIDDKWSLYTGYWMFEGYIPIAEVLSNLNLTVNPVLF